MKRKTGAVRPIVPLLGIFLPGISLSIVLTYVFHGLFSASVAYLLMFLLGIPLVLGLIFYLVYMRTVSSPIGLLAATFRTIADGCPDNVFPNLPYRELDEIAAAYRSLSERLRSGTNELLISERRHRMIIENSSDIIFTFGNDGIIRFVNKRAEVITGYSRHEIEGRHLSDFPVLASQRELLMNGSVTAWFPEMSSHDFEVPFISKSGVRLILDVRLAKLEESDGPETFLGVAHDITEKQRLYHQVIQSEKLSSLGELVAGVAHELNNPLTGVLGYAELMRQNTGAGDSLKPDLEKIIIDATRAKKIVQNLLVFARKAPPEKIYSDLNELLTSVLEVREYEMLVNNIEVERIFEPGLPRALVDQHQMRQVFLNVINNAINAMKAIPHERNLTIITSSDSRYIKITVHDTGPGIPGEYIDKVFDPFFTTMEVGKGVGMGLSVSYGIIKEHGGRITASTRRGEGTQLIIELPYSLTHSISADVRPFGGIDKALPTESLSSARILVVEDDESLLHLIRRVLAKEGSSVEAVTTWKDAAQLLENRAFDILVTDVSVEPVHAAAFWALVRRDHQSLMRRTILISGETYPKTITDPLRKDLMLMKPFTIDELKRSLCTVFEHSSTVL